MDNHRERIANFKIEPPGLFQDSATYSPVDGHAEETNQPEGYNLPIKGWAVRPLARNEVGGFPLFSVVWIFPPTLQKTGSSMVFLCIDLQVLIIYCLVRRKLGNTYHRFIHFQWWKVKLVTTSHLTALLLYFHRDAKVPSPSSRS